jgi:hypothetical protein
MDRDDDPSQSAAAARDDESIDDATESQPIYLSFSDGEALQLYEG